MQVIVKTGVSFGGVLKSMYFCDTQTKKQKTTMAYVIGDDCIACGTCAGECPQGAIHEGDFYTIDPDACVDCGTCADACPVGAISPAE